MPTRQARLQRLIAAPSLPLSFLSSSLARLEAPSGRTAVTSLTSQPDRPPELVGGRSDLAKVNPLSFRVLLVDLRNRLGS